MIDFYIASIFSSILPAAIMMIVLGGIFALILLIASEKLKVKEDPKVEQVAEALPGIDCGACGFAGCSSYAKAVVQNPELIGRCAPGGTETAKKIAQILNIQVSGGGPPKRPIVHCRAHTEDKTYYGEYQGIETCISANALPNVMACNFGCLGFGDCVEACQFDAIQIVDGLATVDYNKCTGCGACAKVCPRNLIEMVPFNQENMMTVACRNMESGKVTRQVCRVGCIGCKLCTKQSDLFYVEENLAHMDYENYQPGENQENAYKKCPTGVIIYLGKTAPAPRQPAQKTKKTKA